MKVKLSILLAVLLMVSVFGAVIAASAAENDPEWLSDWTTNGTVSGNTVELAKETEATGTSQTLVSNETYTNFELVFDIVENQTTPFSGVEWHAFGIEVDFGAGNSARFAAGVVSEEAHSNTNFWGGGAEPDNYIWFHASAYAVRANGVPVENTVYMPDRGKVKLKVEDGRLEIFIDRGLDTGFAYVPGISAESNPFVNDAFKTEGKITIKIVDSEGGATGTVKLENAEITSLDADYSEAEALRLDEIEEYKYTPESWTAFEAMGESIAEALATVQGPKLPATRQAELDAAVAEIENAVSVLEYKDGYNSFDSEVLDGWTTDGEISNGVVKLEGKTERIQTKYLYTDFELIFNITANNTVPFSGHAWQSFGIQINFGEIGNHVRLAAGIVPNRDANIAYWGGGAENDNYIWFHASSYGVRAGGVDMQNQVYMPDRGTVKIVVQSGKLEIFIDRGLGNGFEYVPGISAETNPFVSESFKSAGAVSIGLINEEECDGSIEISDLIITNLAEKIVPTITAEATQSVRYDGTAKAVSAQIDHGLDLAVAYYASEDDRANGRNALENIPSAVGTYYVRASFGGDPIYSAVQKDITFTIEKGISPITAESEQSATYDGTAKEVTASIGNGLSLEIKYYASAADRESGQNALASAPTDAGTYYVRVAVQENANYTAEAVDVTFTINKASVAITAESEQSATYDGTAKEVTASIGNDLNLEIKYYASAADRESGQNALASAPTDAGTYYVRVAVQENANYTAEAVDVTFTINKASVAITAESEQSATYDGTAKAVTASIGNDLSLDIKYYASAADRESGQNALASAPTDAGTYYVRVAVQENANYTAEAVDVTLTINKASVAITAESEQSATYDGTAKAVTASIGNDLSLDIKYYASAADRESGQNALAGAPTDAGTYYVRVAVQENANYTAEAVDVTLTINKASATITAESEQSATYDGTAKAVTASIGNGLSLDIKYYASAADRESGQNALAGAPTDAGTYYVRVAVQGNTNYTAEAVDVTFTINKASTTITAESEQSATYDGTAKAVTASIGNDLSLDIKYYASAADRESGQNALAGAPTDAGTYYVRVAFAGNENYAAASADVTFTIVADGQGTEEPPEDSGCNSAIGSGAAVLALCLVGAAVVLGRKKSR